MYVLYSRYVILIYALIIEGMCAACIQLTPNYRPYTDRRLSHISSYWRSAAHSTQNDTLVKALLYKGEIHSLGCKTNRTSTKYLYSMDLQSTVLLKLKCSTTLMKQQRPTMLCTRIRFFLFATHETLRIYRFYHRGDSVSTHRPHRPFILFVH